MLTTQQLNEIVSKIVTNYNPQKILLFGSYANGTATNESDLDLLIVKETDLPIYKRGSEVRQYLRGTAFPMDIVVYTAKEIEHEQTNKYTFIYNALQNTKLLYEKPLPIVWAKKPDVTALFGAAGEYKLNLTEIRKTAYKY